MWKSPTTPQKRFDRGGGLLLLNGRRCLRLLLCHFIIRRKDDDDDDDDDDDAIVVKKSASSNKKGERERETQRTLIITQRLCLLFCVGKTLKKTRAQILTKRKKKRHPLFLKP